MIREIFVPLLRNASDDAALDAALAIAGAHSAHIAALVTLEMPIPLVSEFGYVPVEFNQYQLDEASADAERRAGLARARLARQAISSEVRVTRAMALWSEETAALHALHCDFSVLGRPDPGTDAGSPRFGLGFRSLLLRSGRPVLVVPAEAAVVPAPRRVELAWKPSPEAARAVHEALPLLARDAQVDVLLVDPQVGEGGHGEQPGADIARHLARHGLEVNVVERPREGRSTAQSLLQHAGEAGAELLVMGGYGHHHWRELVLGGTTRSVLRDARLPVFFAH